MTPAGLILAGGRSSRMGEDKAFVLLDGKSLIAHAVAALKPQVQTVLINSNADPARFAAFGCPVRADCVPGQLGPLAGLLTGLLWGAERGVTHILSAPCDIPHLPADIGSRLSRALAASGAQIAIARDEDGPQPTIGLWPVALAERLRHDLLVRDISGIQAWLSQFAVTQADCPRLANINRPEDLGMARASAAAH